MFSFRRGLADLLRIRFVSSRDKRCVGVIAQEVEQVVTSMVTVQKKKMGDLTDIKVVDSNE